MITVKNWLEKQKVTKMDKEGRTNSGEILNSNSNPSWGVGVRSRFEYVNCLIEC